MARVRRKKYTKKCIHCGKKFTATRCDAKRCSPYCNMDASRQRKSEALKRGQVESPIEEYFLMDEKGTPVQAQPRMIRIAGELVPHWRN